MDFNQIDLFLKVAEHQSFTGAARSLRLQRSSVSRRISALEESLGLMLFHRTTRRVSLTPSGEWLRDRVAPLMKGVEGAVEAIPERSPEPAGVLTVSLATDIGLHLAPWLRVFQERHPAVTLHLRVSQNLVDLEEQGIDLALRVSAFGLADSHLIARPLLPLTAGVYASPSYLKSAPPLESVDDLSAHKMVMVSGMPISDRVPMGTPALFADDLSVVKQCVVAGVGLGWLPTHMAQPSVDRGHLVRALPELGLSGMKLHAVYPPALRNVPKVRAFVEGLVEHLKSEAP